MTKKALFPSVPVTALAVLGALQTAFAADPTAVVKPAAPAAKPEGKQEPKQPGKAPPAAAKGDPTGTWSSSFTAPNGQIFERTIRLAVKGETLTGSTTGRDGAEIPLQDGSFKNGQVSWSTVRERDGRKMTSKVEAKLEGDALKGTMSFERDGSPQTRPFEAKRVK